MISRIAVSLASVCVLMMGCAVDPTTQTQEAENKVMDDRCLTVGSNVPRKDCREVKVVNKDQIERIGTIAMPKPRPGGGN
jgi:hypothetical protein